VAESSFENTLSSDFVLGVNFKRLQSHSKIVQGINLAFCTRRWSKIVPALPQTQPRDPLEIG